MDKASYTDQSEFMAAQAAGDYIGVEPISPKIASLCLGEQVRRFGVLSSISTGDCKVDDCTYNNGKLNGPIGNCLLKAVGIADVEVNL